MNSCQIIGRLGADPELRWTPNGVAVTSVRVAVERVQSSDARASGAVKEVDWIPVVLWRASAEFAAKYLGKGRLVSVEGALQSRTYTVTGTDQKRTVIEVVGERIQALDWPKEGAAETKPGT